MLRIPHKGRAWLVSWETLDGVVLRENTLTDAPDTAAAARFAATINAPGTRVRRIRPVSFRYPDWAEIKARMAVEK